MTPPGGSVTPGEYEAKLVGYSDGELYCAIALTLSAAVDAHHGLQDFPWRTGPLLREARKRGWLTKEGMPTRVA